MKMDAIQMSLSQLQQLFTQRMDGYQDELQAATPSASIVTLTADFSAFRTFIMTALKSLQDQVALLAHQTDNLEMRSRRKILLLHGLPESKNEVIADTIKKVIVNNLKMVEFSSADISRCHRMGRESSSEDPRPILVKIRDFELRNKIWHAKTRLKGSGITLSEFLTKVRHIAFTAARQKFGVSRCWTREGIVFVLGADGERYRIGSLAELEKVPSSDTSKPSSSAAKDSATASRSRRARK